LGLCVSVREDGGCKCGLECGEVGKHGWASMGTGMDEVAFGDALRCGVEKGCDMAVLRTCLRV
jgi:hypothetical protein